MTARLSRNCWEAQEEGLPAAEHVCTGCKACPCHAGPAPAPLRELIAEARRDLPKPRQGD